MNQTIVFADPQEQRLDLYHQRQTVSLNRKDASAPGPLNALSIAQDARLPRVALEFKLDECAWHPDRWAFEDGLGEAIERYVSSLGYLDFIRSSNSSFVGLSDQHRKAFDDVVSSARVLQEIGWPVNWEQNVQAIFETTRYGLRDGKLVDRFADAPETVTLGDEMLLLGTATFYRQTRSKRGHPNPFKAMSLSADNKGRYDNIELHLRRGDEDVPDRFRYCSDWLDGEMFRIAI